MKKNKSINILTIIFVIWFIASIVAIILLVDKSANIAFLLLGQLFMVFSIVGICIEKTPMLSLHYFIGLILITIGLIGININKLSILLTDLSLNQKIFIVILFLSLISTIVTLILYLREKKNKKMKYPFIISNILYITGLIILAFY